MEDDDERLIMRVRLSQLEIAVYGLACGLKLREQIATVLRKGAGAIRAEGVPDDAFTLLRLFEKSPKR